MEREHEEKGTTNQALKYLRSLRQIFPRSYKRAISELNVVKGVKKKELIHFINSVCGVQDAQVTTAVALEAKRLSHKKQLYKKQAYKRRESTNHRGTSHPHQLSRRRRKVGAREKKRALEKINQLCGICGGSKSKKKDPCKKKKASRKQKKKSARKKKDPCKGKKGKDKKKQKKKKSQKPSGVTCNRKQNRHTRSRRKRWVPPANNSLQEPSKEEVPEGTEKNQNSSENKSPRNEENPNGKSDTNPESEHRTPRAQLYIT